jgi:hypothetical protein
MAGYTKEEEYLYNIEYFTKCLNDARENLKNAKNYDQEYFASKDVIYCEKRLEELKNNSF